jgi:cystathionine gamma-lyase
MRSHAENALAVAQYLESSPYVTKVIYPGLKSHPQHELAQRQQKGFGGMISFYIKGGVNEATKFLSSCQYFTLAESLGGIESLAELPCVMTHASVAPEDRAVLGITDSLVRISVGIEETNDLIKDLEQALKKAVK